VNEADEFQSRLLADGRCDRWLGRVACAADDTNVEIDRFSA
jgi:hypothetical protein